MRQLLLQVLQTVPVLQTVYCVCMKYTLLA